MQACCFFAGSAAVICLGVGIVRAVDMSRQCAYVLTTLDLETLQGVDTLQVQSGLKRM